MRRAALLWTGALLAGALGVLAEDPEFAQFLFEKGEQAFRAKDYAAAEKYYLRALEQRDRFPEAAYQLGRARENLDRPAEAIAAYRRCVAMVEETEAPPARWRSLASRGRQALRRLVRRFRDLDRLHRRFLEESLAFARRQLAKRPDWTRRACEAVLRLEPGHREARQLLARARRAAAKAAAAPGPPLRGRKVVRSEALEHWDPGRSRYWSCQGEVIRGAVPEPNGQINWLLDPELEGSYTIALRFRVVRRGADRMAYGLFFGGNGRSEWWSVILNSENRLAFDHLVGGRPQPVRDFDPGETFDPSAWHTLEVRVRAGDLEVRLDGRSCIDFTADDRRAFDGKLALFVQQATVEFTGIRVR